MASGLDEHASLTLAAPKPLTDADRTSLSDMMSRIHDFCRANDAATLGAPYMTWDMDLRARRFAIRARPNTPPVALLRWAFTPHMDAQRQAIAARFRFTFETGEETYFVRQPVSFKGPQIFLNGNEFERTFPDDAIPKVPEAEWNQWGKGVTEAICRRYETVIHPRVVDTIRTIASRRPERTLSVMDLGGGDGALAEMLCARLPSLARVRVVDRSPTLIAEAKKRAERHARMSAEIGDITSGGFRIDSDDDAPDVIVLCGVVAQQVMDRNQASELMTRIARALPSPGFVLIPSYSPALLASRDYEALGFRVHNKTLSVIEPAGAGTALNTNDFYVLEKP